MSGARLAPAVHAMAMLLILTVAPLILWHRVLSDELASFRWSLSYATADLGPWLLLLGGIGFLVPVALSAGVSPQSRLYPRGRGAFFVWGVVLYLMGAVLAIQVFDVWNYAH